MLSLRNNALKSFFDTPYSRSSIALPTARDLITQSDQWFNRLWNDWNDSVVLKDNLYNIENDVKLQEEPDKYIISFKDEDIDTKEMKVDYSKELNELRLSISKNVKEEKDSSYKQYSSTYQSSIKFDKPVAGDELLADVNGGNVMITVPKLHNEQAKD